MAWIVYGESGIIGIIQLSREVLCLVNCVCYTLAHRLASWQRCCWPVALAEWELYGGVLIYLFNIIQHRCGHPDRSNLKNKLLYRKSLFFVLSTI